MLGQSSVALLIPEPLLRAAAAAGLRTQFLMASRQLRFNLQELSTVAMSPEFRRAPADVREPVMLGIQNAAELVSRLGQQLATMEFTPETVRVVLQTMTDVNIAVGELLNRAREVQRAGRAATDREPVSVDTIPRVPGVEIEDTGNTALWVLGGLALGGLALGLFFWNRRQTEFAASLSERGCQYVPGSGMVCE